MNVAASASCGNCDGVTLSASMLTTRNLLVAFGMNSAIVCGRRCANGGSISTAVRSAPVSRIAKVSEPSPGPTSITWSPASTPASRTILRTVPGSITKFCPNFFVGVMPSSAAILRISAAPSRFPPSACAVPMLAPESLCDLCVILSVKCSIPSVGVLICCMRGRTTVGQTGCVPTCGAP